jgi:hypothetical protein
MDDAAKQKQRERDQYSTREQQNQWDAEIKNIQDWSAKPRVERVADTRYVLSWSSAIARAVMDGNLWMTEAIRMCQRIERLLAMKDKQS